MPRKLPADEAKKVGQVWDDLEGLTRKYGLQLFRRVANRYLRSLQLEAKNRKQIAALKRELADLEAKAPGAR